MSDKWLVQALPIHGARIVNEKGDTVVDDIYDDEIAALIVREHNAHKALVEALQRSRDWMVEPMGGGLLHERFGSQAKCEAECLRCAVETALALASKGE